MNLEPVRQKIVFHPGVPVDSYMVNGEDGHQMTF